ncbi:MAG: hypothetical protein HYS44_00230, partial [Candidatus Niyogibacteria bacterium]|nr:hypothetical protein [Candidatus Niyogibacteria bacterium]
FIMATRPLCRMRAPFNLAASGEILPGADRDRQSMMEALRLGRYLESLFILPPDLAKKIGE